MADDLGPILPEPGEEESPGTGEWTLTPDFTPPETSPAEDTGPTTPETTLERAPGSPEVPPVDGLPIDDPLGAPGVGMDVPDEPDLPGD